MTKLSASRGAACAILTVGVLVATAVTPAHARPAAPSTYAIAASTPAYAVQGVIRVFYDAAGGAGGYLGAPTEAERSVNGGWRQAFAGGTIYVLPGTGGTFAVTGDINAEYMWHGAQAGSLGWPVTAETALGTGSVQVFQRGRIHANPLLGASAVQGAILSYYLKDNGESGRFGWPIWTETLAKGAWSQRFENGVGILGSNGLYLSSPAMYDAYQNAGGATGRLGRPVADEQTVGNGSRQLFTGGTLYLRNGVASMTVGGIGAYFDAHGGVTGSLGWPIGTETKTGPGWTQAFEGGTVYASGAGTATVTAPVLAPFLAAGGTAGRLGWPRFDAVSASGSVGQQFSGGFLLVPVSGPVTTVQGTIGQAYGAAGGPSGALGLPVDTESSDGRGWLQSFEGGSILASLYGTYAVPAPLDDAYLARGGRGGVLGYPAGPPSTDGVAGVQRFSGGMLYLWDDGTELVVKGSIGGLYQRNGADAWIGWPIADEQKIAGGWFQDFEYGSIYAGAYGTIAVKGGIGDYYASLGYEDHRLGWPISPERQVPGGWRQDFQGGSIFYGPTGAHWMAGAILQYFDRNGGGAGRLGWPTTEESPMAGGWRQIFARGTVFASGYGTFTVKGTIGQVYIDQGGPYSAVGWPVGEEFPRNWDFSPWGQAFSGGQILANPYGSHILLGPPGPWFYEAPSVRGPIAR